jgi:acetyltransferase-like isoleucine patch superfamily enzyme
MSQSSWRYPRLVWAALSVVVLETLLLGIAVAPALAFLAWTWTWHWTWTGGRAAHVLVSALALVPLYLCGSLILLVTSAFAVRVVGWRTPENVTLRLTDFAWPVLDWGRYLMTIHVVRVFAGPAFRSTPIWSWYLRLNGARIGKLVWVNSLSLMDHNLLDFADDVVIGSDAHVSGHTVEHGMLRTGRVRLGPGTVIGVGSVVGIGVTTGAGTQVGPLSVVPKFTTLEAGASYLGVPVQRLTAATAPDRPRYTP